MSTATVDGTFGPARRSAAQSDVRPAAPRLRLTKRGRGVLTTLAAAPLVVAALVFALNGGMATATLDGSGADFQYVTVDTGQGLWEVAETIAPHADPRDVIAAIMQLNQLESAEEFRVLRVASTRAPARATRR